MEDFSCSAEFLYEQLTAFYLKFSLRCSIFFLLAPSWFALSDVRCKKTAISAQKGLQGAGG